MSKLNPPVPPIYISGKNAAMSKLSWFNRVGRELKRNSFAYIVMLPVVIHFLIFEFGPFIFSFVLTFMNWPLIGSPSFVGLANWNTSLHDPLVWRSLWNTTLFALYYVAPTIVLGFLLQRFALFQIGMSFSVHWSLCSLNACFPCRLA